MNTHDIHFHDKIRKKNLKYPKIFVFLSGRIFYGLKNAEFELFIGFRVCRCINVMCEGLSETFLFVYATWPLSVILANFFFPEHYTIIATMKSA